VTPSLAILIPVLNRPHRVAPLIESVNACTPEANLLFLCSPGDKDEIKAVEQAGANHVIVPWRNGPADYARKMNLGFKTTTEQFIFLGADDIRFQPGWFEACLEVHQRTNACVIGTNDGANARVLSGQHSTHTLVHRDYGECGTIDRPDLLLTELYTHEFVDDELVQTAIWRGTYAHARLAIVTHDHPDWGKAEMDDTYRLGRAGRAQDQQTYMSRAPMWGRGRPW
jgi:glycosyltransferase involved in cell wall biosynthesis